MKRILHISALLVALALSLKGWAQPRCTIDKAVVNMGDVMFRVPRTVTFEIKNTGNKPLVITSAHPSCGCTQVEHGTKPIAPGKAAALSVTYDAGLLGTFHKEVELVTNASTEPVYLQLTGRVTTDPQADLSAFAIDLDNVRLDRNTIEFDDVRKGDRLMAELLVANAGTTDYRPQLMHLPPFLTAIYDPEIITPGHTGRICLTLDSERLADMGLTQRPVYIARYPGDKVGPDNEISVSAVLLPELDSLPKTSASAAPRLIVSPLQIDLGSFGKKKKLATTITLTNMGSTTVNINRLQAFNKALGMSCDSRIEPGKAVKMKVTVMRDRFLLDKNPLRILLICDDPVSPKQTIVLQARE